MQALRRKLAKLGNLILNVEAIKFISNRDFYDKTKNDPKCITVHMIP